MKLFGLNITKAEKRGVQMYVPNTTDAALSYGNIFAQPLNSLFIAAYHRCVDLISTTIAQLPVTVRVKEGDHIGEVPNHPVTEALSHALLTPFTMMKNIVRDVITRGNGYIYVTRTSDGGVKSLRYLLPTDVTVNYDPVKEKLYYTASNILGGRRIEPVNMLHFRMWTFDGVNGVGIERYMYRTLQLAGKTDDAMTKFYENNMNLNGILSARNPVGEKQLEQIKQAWNTTYTSGGGIVVLPNSLDYQPIQSTEADSSAVRERNAVEICSWLGVSPILIGILTHSSNYTFEQARLEFLSNTIMAWVKMMEQEMTRKLLKPSESGLRIDLDEKEMLRADKVTLMNYYTGMISSGILCINEARKELGYNPIEGGDRHIIPFTDVNMNTVGGEQESE